MCYILFARWKQVSAKACHYSFTVAVEVKYIVLSRKDNLLNHSYLWKRGYLNSAICDSLQKHFLLRWLKVKYVLAKQISLNQSYDLYDTYQKWKYRISLLPGKSGIGVSLIWRLCEPSRKSGSLQFNQAWLHLPGILPCFSVSSNQKFLSFITSSLMLYLFNGLKRRMCGGSCMFLPVCVCICSPFWPCTTPLVPQQAQCPKQTRMALCLPQGVCESEWVRARVLLICWRVCLSCWFLCFESAVADRKWE